MRPDFQTRGTTRRRIAVTDWVLWTTAIMLCAASVHQAWRKADTLHRTRVALERVRSSLQSEEARLSKIQQEIRSYDADLAGRIVLNGVAPPERVLASLERLLPPGARFNGITLDYGERLEIALVVVARKPEVYDVFLERLETSPVFSRIAFGAESREGEVRVSVTAVYTGGAT
jgi:hypothetical protein